MKEKRQLNSLGSVHLCFTMFSQPRNYKPFIITIQDSLGPEALFCQLCHETCHLILQDLELCRSGCLHIGIERSHSRRIIEIDDTSVANINFKVGTGIAATWFLGDSGDN